MTAAMISQGYTSVAVEHSARRRVESARRREEALARLAARRMQLPGQHSATWPAPATQSRRPLLREVKVPVSEDDSIEDVATVETSAGADSRVRTDLPRPVLTPREAEVLRTWLLVDSKPAVGQELFISLGTVNTHLTRIRTKYAEIGRPAPTKAALVARAVQDGLISLDEL
ncbi:putative LuxR family transcriptional regulator [Gordonia effusa NBRC 100432]|uniref:Putative LuxR family transcriptional regulator n=1 Tax=Gordonia effusa NBRC 100432 TaxID=1077974 RepID=H0QZM1_9ACTN|nr:LuxR C-terminal-related transcriptional regulator [Gordonia effusa]GAB18272.1 putative LuxR family transcriptional regulator [Gordonia effusa NBRC 100432]